MRKFNVNVNGKSYVVEVDEMGGGATQNVVPVAAAPVAAAPVAAPAAAPAGAGDPVKAPMPGLVKKLCFSNGSTVKKDEPIIILEAMKMDTPVTAPKDGVITYSTTPGTNVESGEVLCTIA